VNGQNGLRHEIPTDADRISQVLAELRYPAAKWQVLAEADHYGADSTSRAQLWTLQPGVYPNLHSVLVALGLRAYRRDRGLPRPQR
jgi:hypothetical protein